jgi:transposase
LEALVVEQAALIVELRTEVAELRRRLAQNSRNSSRPPSSDGLAKARAPKSLRGRSGRKPGGQPGHGGAHLERVEQPDEVIVHVPAVCEGCGGELADGEPVGEARQVFDLPPVCLVVTEHRSQRRRCACGHVTTAAFPAGVGAPTQYGSRIRALGVYLVGAQHLPYQRAAQLLADWLGAPLSPATLVEFVKSAAGDLDEFLDLVHEQIICSPVVHFDETGARVAGSGRWLYCASTEALTFYALHDRRGTEGIDHAGVMPRFRGIAVHDGWPQYRSYTEATHALCNAHHLRELLGVIEQHTDGKQSWANNMDALLRALHEEVKAAKAADEDWLDPVMLACYRAAYEQIITLGHRQNPPPTVRTGKRGPIGRSASANLLRRLDEQREQVLRFAHDFQVPFDNNLVERDIRMIKIQQKISGSWRTTIGADNFLALRAYISTTASKAATSSTPSPGSPITDPGCQPPPAPERTRTT